MALPPRTIAQGNPPASDHQINQEDLGDWMEEVQTSVDSISSLGDRVSVIEGDYATETALDVERARIATLEATSGAETPQGAWAPSGGSFPGGGTAQTGDYWEATDTGTIDSVSFAAGDQIIALVDNASTSTYAGNWFKREGGAVTSVAGKTGEVVLTKSDVGLGNVDNTPDADKPVSTAQQTALNAKAPLAGPAFTGSVDMSGATSVTVPTPTAGTEATTKTYVDDALSDLRTSALLSNLDRAAVGVAEAASAPLFLLDPAYMFQERTVSASTPAEVGDVCGCVVSPDGAFYLLSLSDGTRATVQQDANGNLRLPGLGANYVIFTAAGARWTPSTTMTHVGAWMGTGRVFCVGKDAGLSEQLNPSFKTGVGQANDTTYGGFEVFADTPDPMHLPYVMTVKRQPTDVAAYYNLDAGRRAPVVAPADSSAWTREVGLFMGRTGVSTAGGTGTNYFYGGLWADGALTDGQVFAVQSALYSRIVPDEAVSAAKQPTILDFEEGTFLWRGVTRSLTDLTDNGGGSYTLHDMSSWRHGRTIVADVTIDQAAGSYSGDLLLFNSGNTEPERLKVSDATTLLYGPGGLPDDTALHMKTINVATDVVERARVVLVVEPGALVRAYVSERFISPADISYTRAIPPTSLTINTAVTGATIERVAIYPEAYKEDDPRFADIFAADRNTLHILGDSFTAWGTFDHQAKIYALAEAQDPGLITSSDGVGGVAFWEGNGVGHSQRWARTPFQWSKTLILLDGGSEYHLKGTTMTAGAIMNIVEKLRHGGAGDSFERRWAIVESNPINAIGTGTRTTWEEGNLFYKLIATKGSPNPDLMFIPVLEAMFCAYTDANDITDVGNGIWPRSLTSDGTHPLEAGRVIHAQAIYQFCVDRGWITGTASTVPGVPQNVTGGSGTLTWDAPADDGGHPILGYLVERNTGSWAAVATQGSPSGYTKQYIRSMTGLAAGDYRVAAITSTGTGSFATATVT
ncbi:fibronectin type III domain-containing protein [Sagittula sp. MA-2]|jgi:hypothetical protein|uniref:fibronectin type III domain-containing protein n=1 Tax=Sagittula sp. MA-2 TaxID=3048007 RepID=UPI0024C32756|nr:fibronectin type III domain-containing protein [Sagittula sp. MA-2]WHZ33402.1 fibronectin type III domain-containing protein [Sagittula sp. MA-2]